MKSWGAFGGTARSGIQYFGIVEFTNNDGLKLKLDFHAATTDVCQIPFGPGSCFFFFSSLISFWKNSGKFNNQFVTLSRDGL